MVIQLVKGQGHNWQILNSPPLVLVTAKRGRQNFTSFI